MQALEVPGMYICAYTQNVLIVIFAGFLPFCFADCHWKFVLGGSSDASQLFRDHSSFMHFNSYLYMG